jgi:hypothetical protein
MYVKSRLVFAAIIISCITVLGSAPVQAQDRVSSEGQRLHRLCDSGDKRACVQARSNKGGSASADDREGNRPGVEFPMAVCASASTEP